MLKRFEALGCLAILSMSMVQAAWFGARVELENPISIKQLKTPEFGALCSTAGPYSGEAVFGYFCKQEEMFRCGAVYRRNFLGQPGQWGVGVACDISCDSKVASTWRILGEYDLFASTALTLTIPFYFDVCNKDKQGTRHAFSFEGQAQWWMGKNISALRRLPLSLVTVLQHCQGSNNQSHVRGSVAAELQLMSCCKVQLGVRAPHDAPLTFWSNNIPFLKLTFCPSKGDSFSSQCRLFRNLDGRTRMSMRWPYVPASGACCKCTTEDSLPNAVLWSRAQLSSVVGSVVGGLLLKSIQRNFEALAKETEDQDTINTGVTFDDVAGCEKAKEEVKEILSYLKHPEELIDSGARMPKGVLLFGPSGTGKTLLAKAIATEAKVPYFAVSGASFARDGSNSGAENVKKLFQRARRSAPSIIFIDEFDGIGLARSGNKELDSALVQLLIEMDGFLKNEGVIVIGATNKLHALDAAVTRPGRFDRLINIDIPEFESRLAILEMYTRKYELAPDVDLSLYASILQGFSGALLESLVNEAVLRAVRKHRTVLTVRDFRYALDRTILGVQGATKRPLSVVTPHERELAAYYEAGRALIHCWKKGAKSIYEISIVPDDEGRGHVYTVPGLEEKIKSKEQLEQEIAILYGGVAAEQVKHGKDTYSDYGQGAIIQAGRLARRFAKIYGSSKDAAAVVPVHHDLDSGSDASKRAVEAQVQAMLEKGCAEAYGWLKVHEDRLELVKNALLEHDWLTGDQLDQLLTTGSFTPTPEDES